MSRKTNLDALYGRRPDPKPTGEGEFAAANPAAPSPEFAPANQPPAPLPERRRSGAIGAMSGALRSLAAQADAAAALQTGASVVELDAGLIDDSFIADRVADANDPSLATLVESVRESGQQVPVLVRPHPTAEGRYQIAYGRRRTRAARILERPVRAVIRPLTDAELVVAQGKENLERRDLSFIERAFFALRMEQHGFPRATITSAMGVGKGDLSSLISVAKTVPEDVLAAIGPAPAAGRPRWRDLAEQVKTADRHALTTLLGDPAFQAKGTDERFAAVYTALAPKPEPKLKPQTWKDVEGRKVARVERATDRVALSFDETVEPGLADYVLDRLPEILAAYRASKG
ncbi:plasmid partitioning protein RepB [Methylobacterium sp. CCH5-D2]|uniref:plasmid partitioning protein RepB n=1 Tax=Methylobacterium sp. CCH5-D2 TaxID=1768765 RepID=UPI00083196FC|nr:plasmid partitioning protein RepB [Methylobacterium sp. CCH5-D2]